MKNTQVAVLFILALAPLQAGAAALTAPEACSQLEAQARWLLSENLRCEVVPAGLILRDVSAPGMQVLQRVLFPDERYLGHAIVTALARPSQTEAGPSRPATRLQSVSARIEDSPAMAQAVVANFDNSASRSGLDFNRDHSPSRQVPDYPANAENMSSNRGMTLQSSNERRLASSLNRSAGRAESRSGESRDHFGGGAAIMGSIGNIGEHKAVGYAVLAHLSAPLGANAGRAGGSFGYSVSSDKRPLRGGYNGIYAQVKEFGGVHYQTPLIGDALRFEVGVRPTFIAAYGQVGHGVGRYVALQTKHFPFDRYQGPGGGALRFEWENHQTDVANVGGNKIMVGISFGAY